MPNLKQLLRIKSIYGDSSISSLKKADVGILLEAFNPDNLEKGFNVQNGRWETKAFSFQDSKAKDYLEYFLKRKKAEVVILFIDITLFSRKFKDKNSDELVNYLDEYYRSVFPVIKEYGGEIEKIMGDGIICVFGEPFLDKTREDLHTYAKSCGKAIIKALYGTDFEVKVALHYGEIMYYKNPCDEYYEYTMIGNAVTELFRLESVAKPNSLSFFGGTYIDNSTATTVNVYMGSSFEYRQRNPASWTYCDSEKVELLGINYASLSYIEYTP